MLGFLRVLGGLKRVIGLNYRNLLFKYFKYKVLFPFKHVKLNVSGVYILLIFILNFTGYKVAITFHHKSTESVPFINNW